MSDNKLIGYRILGALLCLDCGRNAAPLIRKDLLAENIPAGQSIACYACETPFWPKPCVFCEIANGRAEVEWILAPDYWDDVVAFVPLDPITEDHCLIVPKAHVRDFAQDPEVFAATARRAAELMRWTPRPMNVLTNRGREAGQYVMHLHLHLIPREAGDGIRLLINRKGKK